MMMMLLSEKNRNTASNQSIVLGCNTMYLPVVEVLVQTFGSSLYREQQDDRFGLSMVVSKKIGGRRKQMLIHPLLLPD
jgi:hypothetical protein